MATVNQRRLLAIAPYVAFLWGYAEGTVFFVVPDVFLSLVALLAFRRFPMCLAATAAGSLLGGVTIYASALYQPVILSDVLHHIPFVTDRMFADVQAFYNRLGVWTLLKAPFSGIPYKIYASFAPAYAQPLVFAALGIIARSARFAVVGGLSWVIGKTIFEKLELDSQKIIGIWLASWCIFYAWYWTYVCR